MTKKRLCEACKRRKLEEAEYRLMESLLCLFYDNEFCPHPDVDRDRRILLCDSCDHYKRFEREMEAEDERVMDEIDETRRGGSYD